MTDASVEPTFLIIGGTTKAATTSLFMYLRDHPEICGSSLKETRYFLDPSYPLPIPRSYTDEASLGYEQYFGACAGESVRVEATPDYLYAAGTPDALHRHLDEVRCVFVLRNPIDRLRSWYRFARQNGHIPESLGVRDYVEQQLDTTNADDPPQYWRALDQGRYARFLERYVAAFGEDGVLAVFFEHLTADPGRVVKRIARFAGVDPAFFDGYGFNVHNRTRTMKAPSVHAVYRRILRAIRYRVHQWPRVHDAFRGLRSWLDPLYLTLAADDTAEAVDVPADLRERLRCYYADDVDQLERLIGQRPPWSL